MRRSRPNDQKGVDFPSLGIKGSTEPCGTHPRFAAYLGTPHAVAMRCAGRRDRLEPVPLENPDARAKRVPANKMIIDDRAPGDRTIR